MYVLSKKLNFEAAHFLPCYDGKCKNHHGHRWEVTIEIRSDDLDSQSMVMDFTTLNRLIRDKYDHTLLNDHVEVPTAENLSRIIWEIVAENLSKDIHTDLAVTVEETPGSSVLYTRKLSWEE